MRRVLIAGLAFAGTANIATTASPQGVEYTLDLSQQVEATRNADFDGSTGLEGEALTSVSLGLVTETPTTRLSFGSSVSLSVDQDGEIGSSRPSAAVGVSTRTQRAELGLDLSYDRVPVQFEETTPDLATVGITADRISTRLGTSLGYALNPTTTMNVGLAYSRLDFDTSSPSLVPSDSYDVDLGFGRELDSLTTVSFALGAGLFLAEDDQDTEARVFRLSGAASRDLTSRASIAGNLGFSVVDTREGGDSTLSGTVTFGGAFDYALPRGAITLSVDQSVRPSASGELAVSTGLQVAYSRELNSRTEFGIGAVAARQRDVDANGGDSAYYFGVSPNISWQIGPRLVARAAYDFQVQDDGEAAHRAAISISRSFNGLLR